MISENTDILNELQEIMDKHIQINVVIPDWFDELADEV